MLIRGLLGSESRGVDGTRGVMRILLAGLMGRMPTPCTAEHIDLTSGSLMLRLHLDAMLIVMLTLCYMNSV